MCLWLTQDVRVPRNQHVTKMFNGHCHHGEKNMYLVSSSKKASIKIMNNKGKFNKPNRCRLII